MTHKSKYKRLAATSDAALFYANYYARINGSHFFRQSFWKALLDTEVLQIFHKLGPKITSQPNLLQKGDNILFVCKTAAEIVL